MIDIFTGLGLLMAATFIAASFFRDRIPDPRRHRLALNLFLAFLVLFFGLPTITIAGPYIGLVSRPIGVATLFICLRVLCSIPASPPPAT